MYSLIISVLVLLILIDLSGDVIGKAIEAKPEDSVFDLPNELSFVTAQIQKLKDQLTKLEEVKMMIKVAYILKVYVA